MSTTVMEVISTNKSPKKKTSRLNLQTKTPTIPTDISAKSLSFCTPNVDNPTSSTFSELQHILDIKICYLKRFRY